MNDRNQNQLWTWILSPLTRAYRVPIVPQVEPECRRRSGHDLWLSLSDRFRLQTYSTFQIPKAKQDTVKLRTYIWILKNGCTIR